MPDHATKARIHLLGVRIAMFDARQALARHAATVPGTRKSLAAGAAALAKLRRTVRP